MAFPTRRALRRVGGWLFMYGLYPLLTITAVSFGAHRLYMRDYRMLSRPGTAAYPTVAGIDPHTIKRLGSIELPEDKSTRFHKFPFAKPDNRVRIGCFGDSFTFGSEVPPNSDYPFLLGEILKERDAAETEVLNFGNTWHGFHQTFITWKYIGTKYSLDAILLGPAGFYANRDYGFSHSLGTHPYFIHSRYVLEDGKAVLKDVEGSDLYETFSHYNAFLPSSTVLRYDRNAPAVLRSLIPSGRTLANPFYYYGKDYWTEMQDLRRVLLREMAAGGTPTIIGQDWPDRLVIEDATSLGAENISASVVFLPKGFPYEMPGNHLSVLGNQIIALQYADLLAGRRESRFPLLTATTASDALRTHVSRRRLDEVDSLTVRDDSGLFEGRLAGIDFEWRGKEFSKKADFEGFKGLIAVSTGTGRGSDILNALYLPIDFEVEDGARLAVEGREHGYEPLGTVVSSAGIISWVRVAGGAIRFSFAAPPVLTLNNGTRYGVTGKAGETFTLTLGGRRLFEAVLRGDGSLRLRPFNGHSLRLRSVWHQKQLPASMQLRTGQFFLTLHAGGAAEQIPLADYTIAECTVPLGGSDERRCGKAPAGAEEQGPDANLLVSQNVKQAG